jgi:hypothetical protein
MSYNFAVCLKASAGGGGGGKKPVQITGDRDPVSVAYVFVFLGIGAFCRLYKLTLSDQAQTTLWESVFHI